MNRRNQVARTILVLAAAAPAVLGGCVVYRDRIITVGQQTRVEVSGSQVTTGVASAAPASQVTPQVTPGVTTVIPGVPGRIDEGAIHAALDPYGSWTDTGEYGQVWVPSSGVVGENFVPYGTNGQWQYTDAGWYWQSGYAFGAVAFHYGRWVQFEEVWGWVPGSAFAPAWVDWRYGDGWVGWSPLPPVGAAYSAPYLYCNARGLLGPGLWERTIGGAAGASLYPRTVAVAAAYGYGGSVYSWGPPPAAVGIAPPSVPVATAWRAAIAVPAGSSGGYASTAPRAGVPVGGGAPGGGTGQPVGARPVSGLGMSLAGNPPAMSVTRPAAMMGPAAAGFHPNPRSYAVPYNPSPGPPRSTVSLGSTYPISTYPINAAPGAYPYRPSPPVTSYAASAPRVATWERFQPPPQASAQAAMRAPAFGSTAMGAPGGSAAYGGYGSYAPSAPMGARPMAGGYAAPAAFAPHYAPSVTPSYAAPSYAPAHMAAPSYAPSYAAPSYAPARPMYAAPAAAYRPMAPMAPMGGFRATAPMSGFRR